MTESSEVVHLHPRRGRAAAFAVMCALAGAGLAWFAWLLADPDWSAGASRRAAVLEAVPVLARVGFFGGIALVCAWAAFRHGLIALRDRPLIALRPDGVADLRRAPPRVLAWGDIAGATIDNNHLMLKRTPAASAVSLRFGPKGGIAIPLNLVAMPREEVVRHVLQRARHLAR